MNNTDNVSAAWRDSLQAEPSDIFFVTPIPGREPPRLAELEGRTYFRFMDFILLPSPVEELTIEQICVVNTLRIRLLATGRAAPAHNIVKDAFAAYLEQSRVQDVAEWGCGYDPIGWRIPTIRYTSVDIDPQVVQAQSTAGVLCFLPDDSQLGDLSASMDAIVGVFVFHFRIPRRHIDLMKLLLRPQGLVLANVYRRNDQSRTALQAQFERAGFNVLRSSDPLKLCRRHEFWMLSTGLSKIQLQDRMKKFLSILQSASGTRGEANTQV